MKYKNLFELIALINANVGDQTTKAQKKLVKIYEKVKDNVDAYNAKVDDLKLEFAAVDDKGNIILDEKGNYKYSKNGLQSLKKAIRDLEDSEFIFEKIDVVNPQGLEPYVFLKDWVNGVEFIQDEEL